MARRCPRCGQAPLYRAYLKPHDRCGSCGLALDEHRADDLPPYLTILAVGHLLIPLVVAAERLAPPPLWLSLPLWSLLALALSLALLPVMKGAVIAVQWAHRMHGFDDESAPPAAPDRPSDPLADRS